MHWGKSRIPLYFLIFSSIFNVILDIIMVTKMDMGVAGVAWATLIAQGISAVLSFGVLLKNLKGLEGKQKTLFGQNGTGGNDAYCHPVYSSAVYGFYWYDVSTVCS